MTVRDLGLDWQVNKLGLRKLSRSLRDHGVQSLYVLEEYQQSTGAHAHMLLHGQVPSLDQVNVWARHAGLADIRYLEPLTRARHNPSYWFKVPGWSQPALDRHRELNGQHLLHATRAFWTNTRTGERLTSTGPKKETWMTPAQVWQMRATRSLPESVAAKAA